ncbi:MAG: pantetheine-phosphate adenylyltransferase [Nocardioides sp.]|nr:pantetheine-phosphate adenylyltransferase [Nocardioides sp.]
MKRAVCPGSFDPVTHGHLDVIGRAAALFDEVVVAVGVNPSKSRLFGPEERVDMITRAVADLPSVRVEGFTGLVTDFCREQDAVAIVKGLRSSSDFDYELPMAHMNTALTQVETVFLPTSTGQSFVSSSLVKEVAAFGGDVAAFLPGFVHEALLARLAERR